MAHFWLIILIFPSSLMPERRPWTSKQDKILKYLKQQRRVKKWSQIAKTLQRQFSIRGRSGKQCRERYHNHLDESIVTTEWTKQEEQTLLQMHELVGNKWSQISLALPGRSDNCVKNHFYSRLRKAIRRLNKIIGQSYRKQFKEIKMVQLYKIVEITELRFKNNAKISEDIIELCRGLKNHLLIMEDEKGESSVESESEGEGKMRDLIGQIHLFEESYRKNTRRVKEHKGSTETNYSNVQGREELKDINIPKQEMPFYEIFKKVCEEIMLQPQ